eukprot:10335938-Alexandrium_andersonii.AAC.1
MPIAILVAGGKGPPSALPVRRDLMPGKLALETGRKHGLAEPQLVRWPGGNRRLQARGPRR